MKQCIICKNDKELEDFYKHEKMTDGHLNKCKSCCKLQSKERFKIKQNDLEWRESEKERAREKYYRLDYKDKHKPTSEKKKEIMAKYNEKYPEKYKAKNASQRLPCAEGNELHHWSYNEAHWKDVIELSIKDHALLHRHIFYDEDLKLYRNEDGAILSKENHIHTLKRFKGEN